jgi:hypothetical protein
MDADALMDYVQSAKAHALMATRERKRDVDIKCFRRTRRMCQGFTVWYLLTWIACWLTENHTGESWVQANRWATAIEFMSTGFAETAAIAELLLTLPSKAGGRAAITHFVMCELPRACLAFRPRSRCSRRLRSYELIFLVGTVKLYAELNTLGIEGVYPSDTAQYAVIHTFKMVGCPVLFSLARSELYERFSDRRYEQAICYFGSLLKIFSIQVTLFTLLIILSAVKISDPPVPEQLLAATTLSVALPQHFILMTCLKDAGRISAQRLAHLQLRTTEVLAFLAIALFVLVGFVAYILAVEASDMLLVPGSRIGRTVYYISNYVYFVAVALVLLEVHLARKHRFNHEQKHTPAGDAQPAADMSVSSFPASSSKSSVGGRVEHV